MGERLYLNSLAANMKIYSQGEGFVCRHLKAEDGVKELELDDNLFAPCGCRAMSSFVHQLCQELYPYFDKDGKFMGWSFSRERWEPWEVIGSPPFVEPIKAHN